MKKHNQVKDLPSVGKSPWPNHATSRADVRTGILKTREHIDFMMRYGGDPMQFRDADGMMRTLKDYAKRNFTRWREEESKAATVAPN